MDWFQKIFTKKEKVTLAEKEQISEPDLPVPFGYKTAWYAIKEESSLSVIEKLNLNIISEVNWKSGIEQTYYSDDVFVSPVVNGYILIINLIGMSENENHERVKEHGKVLPELQYFSSHRVVDYYAWAKFTGGKLLRFYSYLGGEGTLTQEGSITNEEEMLGFNIFPQCDDFDSWSDKDWDNAVFPDEESVIKIAKLWGIDPFFEDRDHDKGLGYVCKF